DPSVIAVGHVEDDVAYIDVLRTFQGSREAPVQLEAVEEMLRDLAGRFHLTRIRIESWQGMGAVQSLDRAGLPVELFSPTAKAHAEEWPVLAQRLASRTLVLPPHARLREELLNLVVELGPAGVRVIDRGQVHQDHAVAVRGVVASFSAREDGFYRYAVGGFGLRDAPVPAAPAPEPAPAWGRPLPAATQTQRAERRQRALEAFVAGGGWQ